MRLIVHHDGANDLENVKLDVRTDGGVTCRLIPGKRTPSEPVDLTLIPAGGSIWMNVEPIEAVADPVSALQVEVLVGDEIACQVLAPITGGDH